MNADGSGALALADASPEGMPSWSPDGRSIVFTGVEAPGAPGRVTVINADGSNHRAIGSDRVYGGGVRWSPDGSRLAYVSHDNRAVTVIGIDGSNRRQFAGVSTWPGPDWSPDGHSLVYVGQDGFLHVVSADGASQVKLPPHATQDGPARWSPDGRRIAFTTIDDTGRLRAGDVSSDGTNVVLYGGFGFAPSWSPDGARVAYMRGDLSSGFAIVNVNGSSTAVVYTKYFLGQVPVAWSPLRQPQ